MLPAILRMIVPAVSDESRAGGTHGQEPAARRFTLDRKHAAARGVLRGEQGALRDMRGRRRGPTPRPIDPRVKQLEAENRRLQGKLQRAETIIALQKKVAEILEIPLKPLDTDETD